jgi:hypothetical protein
MLGEDTIQRAKVVMTLYYFLRVLCLNFSHFIIMKNFNNFFCVL